MNTLLLLFIAGMLACRDVPRSVRKLRGFYRCAKAFHWPRPFRAALRSWRKGDAYLTRRDAPPRS